MNNEQTVRKAAGLLARRAMEHTSTVILSERAWLDGAGRKILAERGDELRQLVSAGLSAEQAADAADRPATLDEILDRIGKPDRAKAIAATVSEAKEQQAQTIRLQESTERIRAARAAWQPPSAEARLTARTALADARKAIGEQSPAEHWHERAVEERQRAWEARFDG